MNLTYKKILILNEYHHTEIGGKERYVRHLIDILTRNNFKVYEMNMYKKITNSTFSHKNYSYIESNIHNNHLIKPTNKNKIDQLIFYTKLIIAYIKWKHEVKKIIKKENIEVVIDNTYNSPISFVKSVKYIWVQHLDFPIYTNIFLSFLSKNIFTKMFGKIGRNILGIKNRLNFPNIVTYSKEDESLLIRYKEKWHLDRHNKSRYYPIALSSKYIRDINNYTHTHTFA